MYKLKIPQHKKPLRQLFSIMAVCLAVVFLVSCKSSGQEVLKKPGSKTPVSDLSKQVSSGVKDENDMPSSENKEPEQPKVNKVSFSAVGDNLIHSSIYEQAAKRAGGNGYDFNYVYENVKQFFADFDVNWINQETLVNSELPPSTYPMFSTPAELGWAAYDAGWRVFSLSNNHSYDKGSEGISATRRFWKTMPDDVFTAGFYTGELDDSSLVIQNINGINIAYLSYTEHTNGLPTPAEAEAHVIYTSETELIEKQVRRVSEKADVVIVSLHWGVEGSHQVTQQQRDLAQKLAEWGTDVIIGTHPHVIQPVEWIDIAGRKTLVAYSLGNFLSAQSAPENLVGLALSFELVSAQGIDNVDIQNVKVNPTVTHYDASYTNLRNYMYKDYTDELATVHGVRKRGTFSREYMENLLNTYIDKEFLILN